MADANQDSKITFDEWKAANPDAEKRKFRQPDRNRDGAVTPQEAKRHFDRYGTLKDLFDRIDANNDGYATREEMLLAISGLIGSKTAPFGG